MLTDEAKIGLHVALTPTWSETAYFADYVLPMGLGTERHDIHSYETHDGQWLGFRQPVLRAARERLRRDGHRHARGRTPARCGRRTSSGSSCPGASTPTARSASASSSSRRRGPATKLSVDEYYGWIFENSVPGLPEKRRGRGPHAARTTCAATARSRSAQDVGPLHEREVPEAELAGRRARTRFGRVYTRAAAPPPPNLVPDRRARSGDAEGRRAGRRARRRRRAARLPDAHRASSSSTRATLADWGWPEYALPTYIRQPRPPERARARTRCRSSRPSALPVQIHTRSANAKWLDEIAHTNPLWMHPERRGAARRRAPATSCASRPRSATSWSRPGSPRASGPASSPAATTWAAGSCRTSDGQRQMMATVDLEPRGRALGAAPRSRASRRTRPRDPDTQRIWWTDVGVHQNLTFPVHPDPISGMHCWHQAVRVTPRRAGRPLRRHRGRHRQGRSEVYERVAGARRRPADRFSPDGTRRPYWLIRPLKPSREAYRLPVKT